MRVVPLGALSQPVGTVVEVHVAGWGRELEGYEVSEWDGGGGEDDEEEERLGGAETPTTSHVFLRASCATYERENIW